MSQKKFDQIKMVKRPMDALIIFFVRNFIFQILFSKNLPKNKKQKKGHQKTFYQSVHWTFYHFN